jgi:transcriptional regulator with XRE-family HTH domain
MDSGSALRTARAARGKTQRQLASDAGTHQPHIAAIESGAHDTTVSGLERHLQALLYRLTVLPTRRRPAWEAALDVADHLRAADEASAFREILQLSDDLAQSPADIRVALVVTPPPHTKDARFDALLAGVVDYWLQECSAPRPAWLDEPSRTIDVHWFVEPLEELHEAARQATPPPILSHGVVLAEAELRSA